MAAAHAVRYQSWAARLEKFDRNALEVQTMAADESHLSQAQKHPAARERTDHTGRQQYLHEEDLQKMGVEINEYLNELVQIGNAKGPDGQALFAGTRIDSNAFRTPAPAAFRAATTSLSRASSTSAPWARTRLRSRTALPWRQGFPATRRSGPTSKHIYSAVDSQNYTVPADAAIIIDGRNIALRAGDNVHTIMAKINTAAVAAKASLDPVTNGLVIETTQPHQLFVQDQGGTVLRDLGIVSARPDLQPPQREPRTRASSADRCSTPSSELRDNLLAGNKEFIGGQGPAGVQASMTNLQTTISELGGRDSRLEFVSARLQQEQPKVIEKLAGEIDLDLTEGITRLKMLDTTHQAALRTAAKILPPH